jgi:hypothetical protein
MEGGMGSLGNLSPQVKKSLKTMTSFASGAGTCSPEGGRASPTGKNLASSYSLIRSVVTFDSPNTKAGDKIYSSK